MHLTIREFWRSTLFTIASHGAPADGDETPARVLRGMAVSAGFDGDSQLWRQARAFLLDAVPHSGSFLDVGAANGHLIECVAAWARERDITLDVFGLELNPRLAAEARRRLPALAHQIYTGNVIDWEPPRRFTYVRTGLEYVPTGAAVALVTITRHAS